MTCGLSNARLELPTLGITVAAFNATIEQDVNRLDHAQIEVSRAAGELIGENLFVVQPAVLSFNDQQLVRLALEPEDVALSREKAVIRLRDPRVVLNYGVFGGVYERTTLGEIARDVFNARDDPAGVLVDIRFTNTDESAVSESLDSRYSAVLEAAETIRRFVDPGYGARQSLNRDFDLGFFEWEGALQGGVVKTVARKIEAYAGVDVEDGGFEFDAVSPFEAFSMIEREFEVVSWVDGDGVLWIGLPQLVGKPFVVSTYRGGLLLREYDVVENASPVTGVIGYGTYNIQDIFTGKAEVAGHENVQLRVEATWNTETEGRVVSLEPKRIQDPVHLANAAERALRFMVYDNTSGELTLNPVSSSDQFGSVFDLALGDQLVVVGVDAGCGRSIPSGVFGVHGLRHRISTEKGWELSVRVGKLIGTDAITVRALVVNPETGKWVDANDYYSEVFGREVNVLATTN